MKIKTSELAGAALAYAVGVAEGCRVEYWHSKSVAILFLGAPRAVPWNPHLDWAQGGPIIERHLLRLEDFSDEGWEAESSSYCLWGETPLIAAMRCYVASKLGQEVEIPEELV